MTNINIHELTYRGETRTDFGGLIIASADRAGKLYRFLFDQHGNHAVSHNKVSDLSNYYGIHFRRARLDGEECLVHIS